MIIIPNCKNLEIKHVVCDYNGTIAKDGDVLPEVKALFKILATRYKLYVITADTFGSVKKQMQTYGCEIKILSSKDHTAEKEAFIEELGSTSCVALGNGNNDAKMLAKAEVGIAIIGDEGCAKETFMASDILCKSISEALEFLIYPKRLIATLRR